MTGPLSCLHCRNPLPADVTPHKGAITGQPYCWGCAKTLFQVERATPLADIAAGHAALQTRLRELKAKFEGKRGETFDAKVAAAEGRRD